jgi:chromosome segregation ATPase
MSKKISKQRALKQTEMPEDLDEKPLFLREGMGIEEEEAEVYDIQKEFAEIKKNRSIPVHTAIASFTAILLGATIWLTYGIQKDIDRTTVGIADFRDINLQELVNALRAAKGELDKIDDKIALMRRGMEMEIERIRQENALEIKKVEQSGLSQAKKRRLLKMLRDEQDRKIRESRKSYDSRVKEKEREAEAARRNLESYRKQVSQKEAAYNREVKRKLADFRKDADARVFKAESMYEEKTKAVETKMAEQKREYQALLKKYDRELKAVQEAVQRNERNSAETENLLSRYRQALIYYAKSRGEHGYVIDPGKKGEMLVDVNPFINLKKGDQAYVLNKDNKVAALVQLIPVGRSVRAKIVKRIIDGEIHPFDKILLKKD